MEMKTCKTCNLSIERNYCSNCGKPLELKRINGYYILHEIQHVLHLEKGIFYTIKEILLRPGQSIKEFITDNRSRLIKPLVFIVITSLIYTLISNYFHIEKWYIQLKGTSKEGVVPKSFIILFFDWMKSHYGYANIIIGMFISFWLKILFRKFDYNFFEIVILLCYVMGIEMLFFSFFAMVEGITNFHFMKISGFVTFGYFIWAIGVFFDEYKIMSYVKAFFAYILGIISFAFWFILLGSVIDLL